MKGLGDSNGVKGGGVRGTVEDSTERLKVHGDVYGIYISNIHFNHTYPTYNPTYNLNPNPKRA